MTWRATVVTLFPEAFPGVLGVSLLEKAREKGLWSLDVVNLRAFGVGKHRQVDDTPSGGGAGMVLRPDVVEAALGSVATEKCVLVAPSPRGKPFDSSLAKKWSQCAGAVFLCGRFEGIDERVYHHFPVLEVSVGDAVLCGGEVAAQLMIEATVRQVHGVLGDEESLQEESFENNLLEYPQYTRPLLWHHRQIPPVLTSGNHDFIKKWRKNHARVLTKRRRPDIWRKHEQGGG